MCKRIWGNRSTQVTNNRDSKANRITVFFASLASFSSSYVADCITSIESGSRCWYLFTTRQLEHFTGNITLSPDRQKKYPGKLEKSTGEHQSLWLTFTSCPTFRGRPRAFKKPSSKMLITTYNAL